MAVPFTTTDLINSIRMRGSIPQTTNANNVNNTSNLLLMATEELLIKLVPMIMSAREDFFVAPPYSVALVQGQANYTLPYRAIGQVVRDIHLVDNGSIWPLPRIEPEQIYTTQQANPWGYYFEGNNIVVYPTPSSTTLTLRIRYFQRPSQLALTSNCAQVTAINTGTNTVTVSFIPSSWAVGTIVDFISAAPPYGTEAIDQAITGLSGTNITFAALPSTLAVNDWIALAEYTPIPQIPREFQPVLAQMTAVKVLQAQGDVQGAQQAGQDLQVIAKNALAMITIRNQGDNRKVVTTRWRKWW